MQHEAESKLPDIAIETKCFEICDISCSWSFTCCELYIIHISSLLNMLFNNPSLLIDLLDCPRRRQIMEDNGYGASKPKCCSDGQYFPWQTRGPHSYCVDDNGNQYGETVTITNIKDLSCYTPTPCLPDKGTWTIIWLWHFLHL